MAHWIRLPKIAAFAAALVSILTFVQSGSGTHGVLGAEPDGPDFSLEVVGAGCNTRSVTPEDTCYVAAGESFTVRVNLDSVAGVGRGYYGVQVRLTLPGDYPSSVTPADLTGDGVDDLVALTGNGWRKENVTVYLNNGDGTLQEPVTFDMGRPLTMLAVGDINNDGADDVVVPGNRTTILLGSQDGTLSLREERFPTLGRPALADLNGDLWQDLVMVDGYIYVQLGTGDGTFERHAQRYRSDAPLRDSAIEDVNGDGTLDLVSINREDASILLGNGDGTFGDAHHVPVVEDPRSVSAADLNLDGAVDIVVASSSSNELTVLLGNGDGTFEAKGSLTAGEHRWWPSFTLADVTGDTIPDLVYATGGSDRVVVVPGIGNGTFGPEQRIGVDHGLRSAAPAQLNGDGVADIATANSYAGNVSVLLSNGDGTFQREAGFPARLRLEEAQLVGPPGCIIGAESIGWLGRILLGCVGLRFYETLYTGPVSEYVFSCPSAWSSHLVTMQHHEPDGTYLVDRNNSSILSGDSDESLLINCVPESESLGDPLARDGTLAENDAHQDGSVAKAGHEPWMGPRAGAETVLGLPSTGTAAPGHDNTLPTSLMATVAALGVVAIATAWRLRRQRHS